MRLKGTVGMGGKNLTGDVLYVQILLSDWLLINDKAAISIDGLVGPKTIAAIRQFQTANTSVVDGLVEPNRSTIKALESLHIAALQGAVVLAPAMQASRNSGFGLRSPLSNARSPEELVNAYLDILRG